MMKHQKCLDINMQDLLNILSRMVIKPVMINIPTDSDIDKIYFDTLKIKEKELICYRKAKNINNSLKEGKNIDLYVAIEHINDDLLFIDELALNDNISSYDKLEEYLKDITEIYHYFHTHSMTVIDNISKVLSKKKTQKSIEDDSDNESVNIFGY